MAVPFSTPTPRCRLVTPYECSCGGLDLDPSLPSLRISYLQDAHVLGPELAASLQLAREEVLADIEFAQSNLAGYWERMLSGSSPRLREIGGGRDV